MTLLPRKLVWLLCSPALLLAVNVCAHSVWIEPFDGKMVIRFAEPANSFEKSPGYLDSLSGPVAFTIITNAPVIVETPKKTNHFLMIGAEATNVAGVETIFTVRAKRKPHFYARWQPDGGGAGLPFLTLDLVPTGKPGEVRVYFRGQPLGGIKATLRTPDDTEKEFVADAEGFIRFASKQSGQHLLTIAHHREPIGGFHGGRAYEQTSHNAALTWRQP